MGTKQFRNCGSRIGTSSRRYLQNGKNKSKVIIYIVGIIIVFMGLITIGNNPSAIDINYRTVIELNALPGTVTKQNYNLINIGMSKQQVIEILGNQMCIRESQFYENDKKECYHFQENLYTSSIDVYFDHDMVCVKNWNE